ncbi:MAG: hypothetical protein H0T42_24935 [Deltaproteobacteria bacterium]|nr:hypothetical protein [Deltaproteobacteria bacterium]
MRALLVALVACGGPATPSSPSKTGGSTPSLPDLAGVRAALGPYADHRFDNAAQARGCPADQSLGEYVAMLVTNGTAAPGSKDTHRLTSSCGDFPAELVPVDPPRDAAFWYCRIDSYTVDAAGESPWHYELRLRMRKADRSVDLGTLGCPGAP